MNATRQTLLVAVAALVLLSSNAHPNPKVIPASTTTRQQFSFSERLVRIESARYGIALARFDSSQIRNFYRFESIAQIFVRSAYRPDEIVALFNNFITTGRVVQYSQRTTSVTKLEGLNFLEIGQYNLVLSDSRQTVPGSGVYMIRWETISGTPKIVRQLIFPPGRANAENMARYTSLINEEIAAGRLLRADESEFARRSSS